jgi:polyether ionophore transport system permease protein
MAGAAMAGRERYGEARARRAVFTAALHRSWRSALLWGVVFGVMIAATEATYPKAFPTPASRQALQMAMQGNTGFAAVFGEIHRIDTVAGYTVYKTMFTMVILAAIWGLLLATRVLRGEEDTGRWELFVSGRTTRGGATAQTAAALAVALVLLWVPTAVFAVAGGSGGSVGIGVGTSLFFATAVMSAAAMAMAIGVLMSQLSANRHDADLLGAGVLAGAYLIRMVADSDAALAGLRWASPLGWIEELEPLTASRPLGFAPIALFVVALASGSIVLATRRDLGASVLGSRDAPPPRTLLLGGQAGLTVRLTRVTMLAWIVALAATGLVFGLVAQAAGSALRGSPTLEEAMRRLGGQAAGAASYLGFVFIAAAGLVAIAVAGQIAAMRNEEAAGRLDNLLVRPVGRSSWLGVRLAAGAALVLVLGAVVGLTAWVGASIQHAGIGVGDMVQAGLNVAPPALFVLGVGGLIFGLWPRASIGAVYGLVIWSFMAEVFASLSASLDWVRGTSPLAHMAPAPAAVPDWRAAAVLTALGVLAAVLGIEAFRRRDLATA